MIPLKLTISSIALIFLTAVMSGCAMGWTKDEPYTQQDWLRDRYACSRGTRCTCRRTSPPACTLAACSPRAGT